MENEENLELQAEAPKPIRPRKRVRPTGFDAEAPKEEEVKVVEEKKPELEPTPEPVPVPEPEPTPAPEPVPAPSPVVSAPPISAPATPRRKPRVSRPLRSNPNVGNQRGIRYRG
jgi:hypothetical protein